MDFLVKEIQIQVSALEHINCILEKLLDFSEFDLEEDCT